MYLNGIFLGRKHTSNVFVFISNTENGIAYKGWLLQIKIKEATIRKVLLSKNTKLLCINKTSKKLISRVY